MEKIATQDHREIAKEMRRLWSLYEENRDLISIGAYQKGNDAAIDEAISKRKEIETFSL